MTEKRTDPRDRLPAGAGPSAEGEEPPILGSWPRLYALVLVLHALLILVYYAISQYYA